MNSISYMCDEGGSVIICRNEANEVGNKFLGLSSKRITDWRRSKSNCILMKCKFRSVLNWRGNIENQFLTLYLQGEPKQTVLKVLFQNNLHWVTLYIPLHIRSKSSGTVELIFFHMPIIIDKWSDSNVFVN